jgi:hypothetical protein
VDKATGVSLTIPTIPFSAGLATVTFGHTVPYRLLFPQRLLASQRPASLAVEEAASERTADRRDHPSRNAHQGMLDCKLWSLEGGLPHNLERIAQDSLENAWMQGRSAAAKQEQISGHSPTQDGGELRIRNNHRD